MHHRHWIVANAKKFDRTHHQPLQTSQYLTQRNRALQHHAPTKVCRSLVAEFGQCAPIPGQSGVTTAPNQTSHAQRRAMPVIRNISNQQAQHCPPPQTHQSQPARNGQSLQATHGQPLPAPPIAPLWVPTQSLNTHGQASVNNTSLSTHSMPSSAIRRTTVSAAQDESATPRPLPIITYSSASILPSSAIKRDTLSSVEDVLLRYSTIDIKRHTGSLAIKLAREAIFGVDVMKQCTPTGLRGLPGLPVEELYELKKVIFMHFPEYHQNPGEFERIWSKCATSVGQACKLLRLAMRELHKN